MSDENKLPSLYRGEIPIREIVRGMERIEQNARELLEDAKLLFANKRYPRAAALAVLALEEYMKKAILPVYCAVQHDPKMRKEAWKAYRNHKGKSSALIRRLSLFGTMPDEYLLQETNFLGEKSDFLKQAGLYTDCYEDKNTESRWWATPSSMINEKSAETIISLASNTIGKEGAPQNQEEMRAYRERLLSAIGSQDSRENLLGLILGIRDILKDSSENPESDEVLQKIESFVAKLQSSQKPEEPSR